MSTDPVMPHAGDPRYFGRYHYAANNPYRYTDPTGENLMGAIGQAISEFAEGVFGAGDGEFNGSAIGDALADGYDGERGVGGFAAAAAEDAVGLFGGWAVSGLARGAIAAGRIGRLGGASGRALSQFGKSIDELSAAAAQPINKEGLTQAARAYNKHAKGQRKTGTFPALKGNIKDHNKTAQDIVDSILNDKNSTFSTTKQGALEVRAPNGQGLMYNPGGKLSGFLDPRR